MAENSTVNEEFERSLALERDAAELQIARYRLYFFAFVLGTSPLFTLAGRLSGKPTPPILPSVVLFSVCTLYAWVLWRDVKAHGARPWLIYVAVTLDLVGITAPGIIFPLVAPEQRASMAVFGAFLGPEGLLVVLMVNLLRMNAGASIYGALLSIPLVLAVTVPLVGFQPPMVGVCAGMLFTAALGMAAARRSRHVLDTFMRLQLLRRYLPASAVERVMREDPDSALALGGRVVTVTLIAADLRGFTALSEKLPPEEVVRQLNAYHGQMLEQVDRFGGALDKFIGDGMLAVFGMGVVGAPVASDAGARDAVDCARQMLEALERHNVERTANGLPALQMGIGVHTGPVVAGNIGAPGKRLEFTVIGDTVNTAARLEALTKDARRPLLISRATVERLGVSDGFESLPPMDVRGRDQRLDVFALAAG